MKLLLFFVFVLFSNSLLYAQQNSEIVDPTILKHQKEVLTQNFPTVFKPEDIKNVIQISRSHSKVIYSENGVYKEAIIKTHGPRMLLIATCTQVPVNMVPAIVMSAFNNTKYNKWIIDKIFSVTTPYSNAFYRIDVYPDLTHKKIKSLFYNYLGEYKKPPY